MAAVAACDMTNVERHLAVIEQGAVWVGVNADNLPVGFLAAEVAGDRMHICELSVQRRSQGQGLGRRLVEHAAEWARQRGLLALTLTTFRGVPWNEPFYQRLGFQTLAPQDLPPDLVQILAYEVSRGAPGDRRCAMRLALRQT